MFLENCCNEEKMVVSEYGPKQNPKLNLKALKCINIIKMRWFSPIKIENNIYGLWPFLKITHQTEPSQCHIQTKCFELDDQFTVV